MLVKSVSKYTLVFLTQTYYDILRYISATNAKIMRYDII